MELVEVAELTRQNRALMKQVAALEAQIIPLDPLDSSRPTSNYLQSISSSVSPSMKPQSCLHSTPARPSSAPRHRLQSALAAFQSTEKKDNQRSNSVASSPPTSLTNPQVQELQVARAEAERLRKENDAVHRKFQDLAAQIKESRQEAEEAKRTLTIGMNDMEQKLKRTTNAVHEQAKSQIERLRSSLVEADKAAASEASLAKSRINTLRQENQLFQRDLTQARATITSLTEQVTEGTQAAKSLAQEQAAHLKTVKRASELSQHLEESKQRLAAVEAQFKSKVSELDSSAQSSSATATAQNLAIRTLQAKLDGTLEELASARARGKSLAAALAKSQAKVERAEKSASAAHTALESLRDELAREHSSSVALAVRNDDLRAKNMKLEAQVKELKAGPPITPLGGLRTPSLNRYRAR